VLQLLTAYENSGGTGRKWCQLIPPIKVSGWEIFFYNFKGQSSGEEHKTIVSTLLTEEFRLVYVTFLQNISS
jgi:hypothetical protein